MTRRANAWAAVRGSEEHPGLLGTVKFFQTPAGVLVLAEVWGLPMPDGNDTGVFGFHVHEGRDCGDNAAGSEFGNAGGHLNPQNLPHPRHMGDLPPLLSRRGYAWSAFVDGRFTIRDILGRTVIIHAGPDDFTTQPSGAAGKMIACGVIR